jgi:hypothetical protein
MRRELRRLWFSFTAFGFYLFRSFRSVYSGRSRSNLVVAKCGLLSEGRDSHYTSPLPPRGPSAVTPSEGGRVVRGLLCRRPPSGLISTNR